MEYLKEYCQRVLISDKLLLQQYLIFSGIFFLRFLQNHLLKNKNNNPVIPILFLLLYFLYLQYLLLISFTITLCTA